jgi:hypothetical protein
MALTSWKEFPFFSVSQVPVPADEDGSYVFDVSATLCYMYFAAHTDTL